MSHPEVFQAAAPEHPLPALIRFKADRSGRSVHNTTLDGPASFAHITPAPASRALTPGHAGTKSFYTSTRSVLATALSGGELHYCLQLQAGRGPNTKPRSKSYLSTWLS